MLAGRCVSAIKVTFMTRVTKQGKNLLVVIRRFEKHAYAFSVDIASPNFIAPAGIVIKTLPIVAVVHNDMLIGSLANGTLGVFVQVTQSQVTDAANVVVLTGNFATNGELGITDQTVVLLRFHGDGVVQGVVVVIDNFSCHGCFVLLDRGVMGNRACEMRDEYKKARKSL